MAQKRGASLDHVFGVHMCHGRCASVSMMKARVDTFSANIW